MAQGEVLMILEKVKKPLSAREISQKLNQDFNLVCHNICRLIKSKSIKVMELNREQAMEYYKFEKNVKRRMRLYYV